MVGTGAVAVILLLLLPPVRQGLRLTRLYLANDWKSARWTGASDSVSMPFRHRMHVLIPVRVNGGPELPFGLDTGAPFPMIVGSPATEDLGIRLGGELRVGGSGSGRAPLSRVARDVSLSVGPVELPGQTGLFMPWQELGVLFDSPEEIYMNGILGHDLLSRYVVEIDFESEMLTLHRPEAWEYRGGGDTLGMTFTQKKPYITAGVWLGSGADVPVKLHLDLGQTSALSLIPGSRPDIVVPDAAVTSEGWGLSGRVVKQMGRVDELRLGRQHLRDVVCSFPLAGHATAGGRQGVIGLGVLSRFRVILDYPGQRMILEETPSTHAPFELDMSGIAFFPHGEVYSVKRIRRGSPAAQSGLRTGDRLISLDGVPAECLRLRDLKARLSGGDGETVRLVVRRQHTVVEEVLTLRRRL